jgi:hypothetical protein
VISFLERLLARHRGQKVGPRPRVEQATLVITHAELSYRHGTGALLIRILKDEPRVIVFYSRAFFGQHDIDIPSLQIVHRSASVPQAYRQIR